MKLFIQIKDGKPFKHPIFEDNFCQAFPDVDINNLPPEFALFERVERPTLNVYETLASNIPTYELIDGIYKDVWHVRDMTAEEKTTIQQLVITNFNSQDQAENWSAWTFDEATCKMVPPIPRPEPDQTKLSVGIFTFWCGADNNWKDTPTCPTDKKPYIFDFLAWQWVEVTP